MGTVPFLVIFGAIFVEATTGDPPNNLAEFKAYHYMAALSALLAVGWLGGVVLSRRHYRRWVPLLAAAWCLWICWMGVWFIRGLHEHPAGAYYTCRVGSNGRPKPG
jgi:hypothetical protein